jgi:hypothetical protein
MLNLIKPFKALCHDPLHIHHLWAVVRHLWSIYGHVSLLCSHDIPPGLPACRHGTVSGMLQKAHQQWRHGDSVQGGDAPASAPHSQQVSFICFFSIAALD